MGGETTGMWETFSRNLLVSLGSAWAQSHEYHFNLLIDCYCAYSTYDLVGEITSSSWWAVQVSCPLDVPLPNICIPLRVNSNPRAVFQRETNCLQMLVKPCSKIPKASSVIHLKESSKGSKKHLYDTDTSSTIVSTESYGLSDRIPWTTAWTC